MPQFGGGGIAQGDSPITTGIASTVVGRFSALSDGVEAAVLRIQDANEFDYFLNVGSSGVPRFGFNDPSSDPDVNAPLASASGGLAVDGSNWMTGRFMSADDTDGARISSRQGVISSINDTFNAGSLDTTLWTATGSPSGFTGDMILNAPAEGVRSTYMLDGDFDIRVAFDIVTGNVANSGFVPRVTYSTAADAVALDNIAASPDTLKMQVQIETTGAWRYRFIFSLDNVQIANTGIVNGIVGAGSSSVRFVRSGGNFSAYYRVPTVAAQDPSSGAGWIQLGATTSYSPPRPGGQVALGADGGTVDDRVEEFVAPVASPVPATATGPQWRIGSLATFAAGEPLVEWYLGPETIATNLYASHEHDADGDVVFTIGQANVFRGILRAQENADPGLLDLVDAGGVSNYVWADNGELRFSQTNKPATPSSGFHIGPGAFAGIYVTGGAVPQAMNATPGTFDKVTGFTNDQAASQIIQPDSANDQVVASVAGLYLVTWQVSFTGDPTPASYTFAVFVDGAEVAGGRATVGPSGATTLLSASGVVLAAAAAADAIDLRAASDQASVDMTPVDAQLVVVRVG